MRISSVPLVIHALTISKKNGVYQMGILVQLGIVNGVGFLIGKVHLMERQHGHVQNADAKRDLAQ